MPGPAVRRAVAASALADLVDAPERAGTVLSATAGAIVIRTETSHAPRCVCLLAHGLTRLPNSMHTDPADLTDPAPEVPVVVGAGGVRVGNRTFVVVRWWDCAVRAVQAPPVGLAVLRRATDFAELGVPRTAVDRLEAALTAAAAQAPTDGLPDAVDALIGSGVGLTPGGDDVLAGVCVGLHATGRTDLIGRLTIAGPADPDRRTTSLSADLLRLAQRGQACGEVLRVLSALHAVGREPARLPGLTSAVQGLLAVGHSSGADLATGLLLGLRIGAAHGSAVGSGGPAARSSSTPNPDGVAAVER